jgi:hypothetical protein
VLPVDPLDDDRTIQPLAEALPPAPPVPGVEKLAPPPVDPARAVAPRPPVINVALERDDKISTFKVSPEIEKADCA